MSETLREKQLEGLIRWMIPHLTKQRYVEVAKRRLAQDPHEWQAECAEWDKMDEEKPK